MRIIAGSKRRTNLYGPDTKNIRPTTDRAKESLFNLIGLKIKESIFIDLFSGTGAIALEAKSRGAKKVIAVDKAQESIELIQKNSKKSNLDLEIMQKDVNNFLEDTLIKADIIFLDAPFNIEDSLIIQLIDKIQKKNLLKDTGLLIVERQTKKENEEIFMKYNKFKIKKYGKVSFIMIG